MRRLALVAPALLFAACGGDDSSITAPSTGTVQVTTTTTGDASGSYSVTLDGASPQTIGANASVSFAEVVPGPHAVELTVPESCTVAGDNPRTVSVTADQTTSEAFAVSCPPPSGGTGSLSITTATTGTQTDPDGYAVAVDGGAAQPIGTTGTVAVADLPVGDHTVALSGVADNCTVADNPRTVGVTAGATVEVDFTVACSSSGQTGSLTVTTATTGTPMDPDGYAVAVDAGAAQPIAVGASFTFVNLAVGNHTVTLSGMATNCTVSGDNPRTVAVTAGATATVAFAVACSGTPTGELAWTPMQSGTPFALNGIWGAAANDVYVVGEPGGAFTSTIFHFNGSAWGPQSVQDGVTLYALWGSGPTDVFAVGSDPLGRFGYQGAILHWNGSAWGDMNPAGIGTGEVVLYSVWGSSPTDVFAVGQDVAQFALALVAHFDGSGWTPMALPQNMDRALEDVTGSSGQDVWAVGYVDVGEFLRRESGRRAALRLGRVQSTQAILLHFDGTAWTEEVRPEGDLAFFGAWSAGPADVFAVGTLGPSAAVYHFNGTAWSAMTVPPVGPLFDVWGSSGTDVYAAGEGTILHYNGTSWTEVQTSDVRFSGVWSSSATDVFAVGSNGTILHGAPAVAGARRP